MILAKAPLRVSLFGGGSDLPEFYTKCIEGGATFSTAIDKHVYVSVMASPKNHIKATYSKQEIVTNLNDLQHSRIKKVLETYHIKSNIEINTFADIPTIGSGLGGSSAFTCALIAAVAEFVGDKPYSEESLAEYAYECERSVDSKCGKQDQYASAFGGFNFIQYDGARKNVHKLNSDFGEELTGRMLLIPTGITRDADEVLGSVKPDEGMVYNTLNVMARRASIIAGKYDTLKIEDYGKYLDEAWNLKKDLSPQISSDIIDDLIHEIKKDGACGTKLLGAGAGGYILALYPNHVNAHRPGLRDLGIQGILDFNIAREGAKVVYRD